MLSQRDTVARWLSTQIYHPTCSRFANNKVAMYLRNVNGKTALDLAERNGHKVIAKLLRKRAAKSSRIAASVTSPPPPLLTKRVRISGLTARPELNGQCGVAASYDAEAGRYAVQLDGGNQSMNPRLASRAARAWPRGNRPCRWWSTRTWLLRNCNCGH